MKKSLSTGLVLVATASVAQNPNVVATQRSEWIKFNPVTPLTAASFASPPLADRPWVRMNMPATADPAELAAEVRELREKGIAGAEVGQGAFPDNDQLVALYTAANQLGLKVSLSHGPTQNLSGYSMDKRSRAQDTGLRQGGSERGRDVRRTLPSGTLTVVGRGGFGGVGGGRAGAGAPGGGRGGAQTTRTTLIALLAYPCTTGPAELDRALTSAVTGRNNCRRAGRDHGWLCPLDGSFVAGRRPVAVDCILDQRGFRPTGPIQR